MDLIFRFPISATLKENESKRRPYETTPQTEITDSRLRKAMAT